VENTSDPVARFEVRLRRIQHLVLLLTVAGLAVETVVMATLFLITSGGRAIWVFVYVAASLPVGLTVFVWAVRRAGSQLVALVNVLRERLLDAGLVAGTHAVLVFDNGIVAMPAAMNVIFAVYASPVGGVSTPQTAAEAKQLSRGASHTRGEGSVSPHRGPEAARVRLAEITQALQVRGARALLRGRRSTAPPDMQASAWTAALIVTDPKWATKGERWLAELDAIRDFLERLRTEYFPPSAVT